MSQLERVAQWYMDFATMEARGNSPLYEELCLGVAGDDGVLALLDELPPRKRQPNLLLAAVRHVAGTPTGYAQFRQTVLDQWDAISATMLARATQTNEVGRCTALYPLLAALPQPVALLEVGTSAGLCLFPDRYGYDYDGRPAGAVESPLTLRCQVEGAWPSPVGPDAVTVAWRAGIDLNPLDVTDPDDMRWLRTLVWPEQAHRLERLNTAIALAQGDPPRIVAGDLNDRIEEVAAQVPADATLVVFHTAVLHYVRSGARESFVDKVHRLPGHWIAQEGPGVLPAIGAQLTEPPPNDSARFIVSLDGRPVAFSKPHGGWLRWLP
jgi:hypothetical protein